MYSGYEQYRTTAVQTAPPEQLIVMLYDGGLRFLEQAKSALREGKDPAESIGRAQEIIVELMTSLNRSAGQISDNLHALYDFWIQRLMLATIRKDTQMIDEVSGMMRDLRESWATVALQKRQAEPAPRSQSSALSARG